MNKLDKKWFPAPAPPQPVKGVRNPFDITYFKWVKTTPNIGGRNVCKVTGNSKEEVEELVKYICDLHNQTKGF